MDRSGYFHPNGQSHSSLNHAGALARLPQTASNRPSAGHTGLRNGPEFISKALARWAAEHQVELAFIQPGKPAQNAFIERFNRTFREDILDAYLFHSIEEVQVLAQDWLEEYNAIRPHESLGGLPPYQFALKQL